MKKWIGVLLFAVCMFFNSAIAKADVIWTPDNDMFWATHENECEYVFRQYVANGPDGCVTVYESPVSSKEITTIENGTVIWACWSYVDSRGVKWVLYDDIGTGWIPTNYFDLVYDYISFEEDHGDEIKEESGQLSGLADRATIHYWSYPGAKEPGELIVSSDYLPEYAKTYTDENGKVWAYCNYYMGNRNFWMYLEDVTADAEAIYGESVNEMPDVMIDEADKVNGTEEVIVPTPFRSYKVIGFGVLGIVIITAIILMNMKKNKEKEKR